jgi:hypothetical protein
MIESHGIGTVVLIIAVVLSCAGMAWSAVIIIVGPRRYREWERRHGRPRGKDGD